MEVIPGRRALCDFRIKSLIEKIDRLLPREIQVISLRVIYVHYIKLVNENIGLPPDVRKEVDNLLLYGSDYEDGDRDFEKLKTAVQNQVTDPSIIYVAPRPGTVSPWSSKATNISDNCELGPYVSKIERGEAFRIECTGSSEEMCKYIASHFLLHDRMTQIASNVPPSYKDLFGESEIQTFDTITLNANDREAARAELQKSNIDLGLAMANDEIEYLVNAFSGSSTLTDVGLFMFAQVNSEHCRHKIFNAEWTIDSVKKPYSLFGMIRNSHRMSPEHTVSAYSDNAAVLEGRESNVFAPRADGIWSDLVGKLHYIAKVETHNHPTAVSPFPGAATGSGGEIRDEGAVGIGSKPKVGLGGFSVSDLHIPELTQPWELLLGKPNHIAAPLDIMLEAPIGSAAFNNEFGRPVITGYFRTLSAETDTSEYRGFHKPIMIAGGLGTVQPIHALKGKITPGAAIIVLGGPSMLVGLGGGAASSMASGETTESLDFASVQRGNPEMQRRAQMVIDACTALGDRNPIQSIHDVGAGGLSNALPELVHDAGLGAIFQLRDVPCDDHGMSPLQIWCCEAQERYVMAVAEERLPEFVSFAERERCPFAVIGRATEEQHLVLEDQKFQNRPIDLPMSALFGNAPKLSRTATTVRPSLKSFDATLQSYLPNIHDETLILSEAISRVLQMPAVGSKSFLITIGDRSVSGLVARDQMVGPWQVPVADVGVTYSALGGGTHGEAMAMGEKPLHALTSPAASARMCVAEALLNLGAADFSGLDHVRMSANWMASADYNGDGAGLYEAVQAIGMEVCPSLGLSVPVGKDSMSMKMEWEDQGVKKSVVAPVSLILTAFTTVDDVTKTWTPQIRCPRDVGPSALMHVDLSSHSKRLGGSILAQAFRQLGDQCPDLDSIDVFKGFMMAIAELHKQHEIVLAYHDISDGGLFVTLSEMAFAGHMGLEVQLPEGCNVIAELFNEELGAVFQVREQDLEKFTGIFLDNGVTKDRLKRVASISKSDQHQFSVNVGNKALYRSSRGELQQLWSRTSHAMQKLRDNPQCADQEFASIKDDTYKGLFYKCDYKPIYAAVASSSKLPRVAILREQGVNGHNEMAYAFHKAGFEAVDVHMSDIIQGRVTLDTFKGLAACGGFSYGDVLGAGSGWAKTVLMHPKTREEFRRFFTDRSDTFALGVCNGCQFLSQLTQLIPGTSHWPTFQRNISEQYEARFCQVEITNDKDCPSIFFTNMDKWQMPIVVAHGEGKATFADASDLEQLNTNNQVCLRYLGNDQLPTTNYPANPNGSPEGIAGVQSTNGRFLALMPHPERTILKEASSWYPKEQGDVWGDHGPWLAMFENARRFVDAQQ